MEGPEDRKGKASFASKVTAAVGVLAGLAAVIATVHQVVTPQSLTVSVGDGEEIQVTASEYSDLMEENRKLHEENDALRSGDAEDEDVRDARSRWMRGDREGALDILVGYAGQSGEAGSLYSSYASEFEADLLARSEELVSSGKHDDAVSLLREGASHLADPSRLEERAAAIETSAPVPLSDLSVSESRYFEASEAGQLADTVGNSYPGDSAYTIWEKGEEGSGYAVFHLGGGYTRLDGTIAVSVDSDESADRQVSGVIEIRVRDEGGEFRGVYTSPVLTRSTEPIRLGDAGIDLGGADWMEISYHDRDGVSYDTLRIILSSLSVSGGTSSE